MPPLVDLFGYLSILARAGTLICQSLLVGGVLFLFWVTFPPRSLSVCSVERVRLSCLRLLRVSAIGLVFLQTSSLYIDSVVLMTSAGISFVDVIGANFFVAGICMLIGAVCTALMTNLSSGVRHKGLPFVVLAILFASVMTSHAAARVSGRPLLIALTLVHEIATGFWIGGLPFLISALFRAKDRPTEWYLTKRFSGTAIGSVGILVGSGLAMSRIYIGSSEAIFGTSYGVMVIAKAAMLGMLMTLGGINFLLLRNSSATFAVPTIRSIIEAELGIGLTVILAAVSLTSQPPAVDLGKDTVSPRTILARVTPSWPRLSYPNSGLVSTNGTRETAKRPSQIKNGDGEFLSYKNLADIEESEANHHWMGLIVCVMGVLALMAQTGKAEWAHAWPLLLIGISIFLMLRADTESWPFGPQGFWIAWLHSEVFQHRLAALACAGFAIFELRTRKRGLDNNRSALVFPLMCALAGAVLLTHSHSIGNVKEELLAELSHVPLGILAVLAGWSRWLEVRLPVPNRQIPSWIWPICFVLIAVNLLNYREL